MQLPEGNDAAAKYLMSFVFGNQHRSVADLLENSNFDVNYAFGRVERNLLQIAANVGSADCLSVLLKHGCEPNYQDISGCTALHLAARNGKRRCVQKLLEYKADPAIRNNEGLSTMHWLAVNGRAEILIDLLSHFNDLELEDVQGQTPLHVASQNGHKKTVQVLLEHGANVNKANHSGFTALHFACKHGQRDIIPPLLEYGAHHLSNKNGDTPMSLCIMGGYGTTLQLLLNHFPRLYNTLVSIGAKLLEMKYDSVMNCFRHLCITQKSSILNMVSEFSSNSGFQLLSISSDYRIQVSTFKSAIEILTVLHEGSASAVFQPLEVLWRSLEEWMVVLKQEIADKCKCDLVVYVFRVDFYSSNFLPVIAFNILDTQHHLTFTSLSFM